MEQREWDYLEWSSNYYCKELNDRLQTQHDKKLANSTAAITLKSTPLCPM